MRAYLAGPMRGKPQYNFPAFHEAAKRLRENKWEIVSPAEMDEKQDHFNPKKDKARSADHYIARDHAAIMALDTTDWIILLPGWRDSLGATSEAALGRWRGMKLLEYFETPGGFVLSAAKFWGQC